MLYICTWQVKVILTDMPCYLRVISCNKRNTHCVIYNSGKMFLIVRHTKSGWFLLLLTDAGWEIKHRDWVWSCHKKPVWLTCVWRYNSMFNLGVYKENPLVYNTTVPLRSSVLYFQLKLKRSHYHFTSVAYFRHDYVKSRLFLNFTLH